MGKNTKKTLLFALLILTMNLISLMVMAYSYPMQGKIKSINGFQYRGTHYHEEGVVQYQFSNKLYLNVSSTGDLDLDIEFSDTLSGHYAGVNLNLSSNSQNNYFQVRVGEQGSSKSCGNVGYWKDRNIPDYRDNSPITHSIPFIHNIAIHNIVFISSIPLNQNLEIASIESSAETPGESSDDFNIEPYSDISYQFSMDDGIEAISIFYILDDALISQYDDYDSISWAYYDPMDEIWYLLESSYENDLLILEINGIDNSDLLNLDSITIAPVFVNPSTNPLKNSSNAIIASVVIILAIFGLIMSKQEYRDYLLNRVLQINKGVHRHLNMEDVLENENRQKIIDYILDHPGVHFNQLQDEVNVSGGNLAWHLDVLETFKVIRKIRVGHFLTYFPYYDNNPISKLNLKIRKSRTTLEILQLIFDNPGIYQNKIAKRLALNHKTVKYHLDKLLEADVIYSDDIKLKKGLYPKSIVKDENLLNSNAEIDRS